MQKLVDSAKVINQYLDEISTASSQQAIAVEEVVKSIQELDSHTQQNAALVEQTHTAACQRPLQYPAVHRVRGLSDRAVAFQVADDNADGLRGQQRHAGDVGAGKAGIGVQHGENGKLRRRDAEIGECALQRQPRRGLGLPQQIGDVAGLAALAGARRWRPDAVLGWNLGGGSFAPGGFLPSFLFFW